MPVKGDDIWNLGLSSGAFFIKTSGKFVEFNGISECVMSVPDEDDHTNEVYATFPKDENVTFDFKLKPNAASKNIYYQLTVVGGKRRIRKAVRMEEKLRRIEVKYGHKIFENRFDRQQAVVNIMNLQKWTVLRT